MEAILSAIIVVGLIVIVWVGVSSVVLTVYEKPKPRRPSGLEGISLRLSWKLERDINYYAEQIIVADALMILANGHIDQAAELGQAYLNNEMPLITLVNHIAVLFVEVE